MTAIEHLVPAWSSLASLPPEVEVPLPLGVTELPVVGDELELAELAAGSPIVDPAPLGAPLCAYAKEPHGARAVASAIAASFMAVPFG